MYTKILGIEEPWSIADVELDEKQSLVRVQLEHAEGKQGKHCKCPCCERELAIYDHSEERRWRHLDTCQYETWLCARLPRVKCPKHGVRQVRAAWAEPGSRPTLLFESHAIEVLTACEVVSAACGILRISWDQGWRLIERAVACGKGRTKPRRIAHIGADEKAFAKGHSYITIVCDVEKAMVEYVADDRKKKSLAGFFEGLSPAQHGAIEAVAIDMHEPHVQAIKEQLPLAEDKIVHDRFNVMQPATKAVDATRRQEHKRLTAAGDRRLSKAKYRCLKSQENLKEGPSGFPMGRHRRSRRVRLSPQDFRRHGAGVQVYINSGASGCVCCWNQEKRSWALRGRNPTRDILVAGAPRCIRPLAELLRQRLLFEKTVRHLRRPPKIPWRKPRRLAPWLGSSARHES